MTVTCWSTAASSTTSPSAGPWRPGCTRIFVLLCGPLHYHPRPAKRPAEAALTAFFVAIHARFVRELTAIPPGVEVVVFSGGGEPSAQYRDFSGTATMIEEGRAEVAEVLDRYAGTSQDVTVPQETAPMTGDADDRATTPGRADDGARTSAAGGYLLDNAAAAAGARFTAFGALFDPSTFRHMAALGLAPGWRCWEVGAGGSSVVRFLADRVGPEGLCPGHRHRRVVGRRRRLPAHRWRCGGTTWRPTPRPRGTSTWCTPAWSWCT